MCWSAKKDLKNDLTLWDGRPYFLVHVTHFDFTTLTGLKSTLLRSCEVMFLILKMFLFFENKLSRMQKNQV